MINLKQLQQTSNQALNDLLDDLNATNIFSLFKTSISIAMIQKTVDFNLIKTVDDLNIAYAKSFVANFRALDTISTKINDNKIYDFLLAFRGLFLSLTIDKATSQSDVDWQNFLKLLIISFSNSTSYPSIVIETIVISNLSIITSETGGV